jgi:hypothetical protein
MAAKPAPLYPVQKRVLVALGEHLRLARLRRKLTIELTCQRAGISRMTLFRAEAGSPAIALVPCFEFSRCSDLKATSTR